ncbi:hypothetical protein [Xylella fastidiosa]|nr:hypothetical protein [Xylella fastidiosa]
MKCGLIALRCVALRCVALRCVALRCRMLPVNGISNVLMCPIALQWQR